ncbi:MAG: hypothetical protein LDL26_12865 [Caenispirillum bisanense]|nr:hypothetical protein [Caenispirillum bisanense]MCA1975213.1 hypothetical protein [Caenispirillum sp.]
MSVVRFHSVTEAAMPDRRDGAAETEVSAQALEEIDRRLAALDRGERLTGDELHADMEAWKAERREQRRRR